MAYMGDDRRGGHTWKFVSRSVLTNPQDKRNSRLLHKGTLFVAQFNPDGTGRWIPLDVTTPIDPVVPSVLGFAELAALGTISRDGNTRLPQAQRGGRANRRWRIADRDHPGDQRPDRADRGRGHHELQDQRRYQTRRDGDPGGLLHQSGRGFSATPSSRPTWSAARLAPQPRTSRSIRAAAAGSSWR